jgi:NADH-quinone oxidoreductase subunit L
MLWLLPALPAIGALLNATIGRSLKREPVIAAIAVGSVTASFVVALVALAAFWPDRLLTQTLWTVLDSGGVRVDAALSLDPLSILLVLVVTGVGALIHVYSTRYMATDPGYWRYFAGLNAFVAAMLLLLLADNFVVLFVGWEGVGLCSWLLIGFWFQDLQKVRAANRAFLVNRLGDLGLVVGMLVLFSRSSVPTFQFRALEQQLQTLAQSPEQSGWVTLACLLIFAGAAAKSAQLPFQAWLPDAMAGPTPVSALIHAATMVTAGVYLLVRLSFLYSQSTFAMTVVACIGAATALYGASCALVQTDFKRVLAYSTISQLGFMFLAVGVGAYWAAIFHLVSHAFFKACLFLGAGSVLHQTHHQQDLRKMGGLGRRMPITAASYAMGALALAGMPVAGSFFSKDDILHGAFTAGENLAVPWLGGVLWALALFAALGTSIYAWRSRTLAFSGEWRGADDPAGSDAPRAMSWVLVALCLGSVASCALGLPAFERWLRPVLGASMDLISARGDRTSLAPIALAAIAMTVAAIGLLVAARLWAKGPRKAVLPRVTALLGSGWGFDWFYDRVIARAALGLGRVMAAFDRIAIDGVVEAVAAIARYLCIFEAAFDYYVVDGMVHLVGEISMRTGKSLRRLQSGSLMRYLYVAVAGAMLVVCLQLWIG